MKKPRFQTTNKDTVNLIKWLQSPGPLSSFYYVVGTEPFFVSEIKKTFIKHVLSGEASKDFNQDEVLAGKTSVEELLTLMETLPFMSERRLLFCDQTEKFSDADWKKLIPVLKQGVNPTVLVCFFDKKDGRKKHFKFLKEYAVSLLAQPLQSWELEPWLGFLSKKEGLEFSSYSKMLFSQLMGSNLMEIQMELKKLKQYMGENTKISQKDILSCTSRVKMDSVFDLTDAIGRKDVVQSLRYLANLLEHNQNELGALAMLARHIRILSILQKEQKQNLSKNQMAQKAGISPYFLKSYLNQTSLWSKPQIHQTLEALFETDKALKFSPMSSHIWLENFILKTCS